jgi:hypothetical protein
MMDQQQHLSQLSEDSNSFAYVEYYLRQSLHATTAKIVTAHEVSNPTLTLQFEKRCKDVLTVDAWLDVSRLEAPNQEEEVLTRGFHFDGAGSGQRFTVGRVPLEREEGAAVLVKRFLLCKVAIGRSCNAVEDYAGVAAIPDGYDSFFIDRDLITIQQPNGQQLEQIGHQEKGFEYIIKDSAQILPTFVVAFQLDFDREQRSRQKVQCENCDAAPATVFCQADSANLCARCDEAMHSTKLLARHQRVALDSGPQTFSYCRAHSDKIVEFFCPTCSKPVCVHCKMVGHHSAGEAARHKLITVAEAFRSVSESAGAADPLLAARKANIRAQVGAVAERAKQVESNSQEIKVQLDALFQKTLNDLQAITKRKLNVLKGDTVELYRQLGEIEQLEGFLQYQQTGGNATQFILDWAHHQRLRQEQHSFPFFRSHIDVLPDIKINGTIQVHVDTLGTGTGNQNNNSQRSNQETTSLSDPLLQAARQSILGDGKPRYSPTSRSRMPGLPEKQGGQQGQSRRATDFLAETLQSMNFAGANSSRADIVESAQP